MSAHYDDSYFDWQKEIGAFGGIVNLEKFEGFLGPWMNVLEFGCGGGYLLGRVRCRDKIGIEVNPAARKQAAALGIRTFETVAEAPDAWADCVISNHALEHVVDPFDTLVQLKGKIKAGALIVCVVPYDSVSFKPGDINRHLYSWSPMTLGNLFAAAGFHVVETERLLHKWPPFYEVIYRRLGRRAFNALSRIYGFLTRHHIGQIRIVARKPEC